MLNGGVFAFGLGGYNGFCGMRVGGLGGMAASCGFQSPWEDVAEQCSKLVVEAWAG